MDAPVEQSLWRRHVIPFIVLVGLLAVFTLAGDYVLHRYNLVWVGRYLGIPGTLLIVVSMVYSLRKRKLINAGAPKQLLSFHEFCAWLGSALVLVHAGVHFNAILPWLATLAMSVNVVSGLVGKLLLGRARDHVQERRAEQQQRGATAEEVEQLLFWDSLTYDLMTRWRTVHIPIFVVFAVLAIGHIVSIFLFWGWA